jgi:hypothetical protein
MRTCDESGVWRASSACADEGVCMPGDTFLLTCSCGEVSATCDDTCHPRTAAWHPPVCVDASTLSVVADLFPACIAGACALPERRVACAGGCASGACLGSATLISGLGGTSGFGPSSLAAGDEEISPAISLPAAWAGLRFYDQTYSTMYVRENGMLTLGAPGMFLYSSLPLASVAAIAPFMADVDTRSSPTASIAWSVDDTRVVATWSNVGYFDHHGDRLNSFQLILTRRSDVAPGDFDIELRYARCEWTLPDGSSASGALPLTGLTAGDGTPSGRALALPGSGTEGAIDLCGTSNVGMPGIWRYQVRAGIPM